MAKPVLVFTPVNVTPRRRMRVTCNTLKLARSGRLNLDIYRPPISPRRISIYGELPLVRAILEISGVDYLGLSEERLDIWVTRGPSQFLTVASSVTEVLREVKRVKFSVDLRALRARAVV